MSLDAEISLLLHSSKNIFLSMRKVILYIAVSLDGYIADSQKSVHWIKGQDDSAEMLDTYTPFFASVDTVIMGKRTYDQIVTELSPERWPYPEAETYVFTHERMVDTGNIKFVSGDLCGLVNDLRQGAGKNIWICGGANVVNQLLRANLIDVFHIATIPTILGSGIKLFGEIENIQNLRLIDTTIYNGIIEAVYERKAL